MRRCIPAMLLLLASTALAAAPEPATAPGSLRTGRSASPPGQPPTADQGDCALDDAVIPDFALQDLNPNSPTYEHVVTRDELIGHVLVMYWAQST